MKLDSLGPRSKKWTTLNHVAGREDKLVLQGLQTRGDRQSVPIRELHDVPGRVAVYQEMGVIFYLEWLLNVERVDSCGWL